MGADVLWELGGEGVVASVLVWAWREIRGLLLTENATLRARLDAQNERHDAEIDRERQHCAEQIQQLLDVQRAERNHV